MTSPALLTNVVPFVKFTDSVLDYERDWTGWLAGDVITASIWTPDKSGILVQSSSFTNSTATVWLAGGPVTQFGFSVRCVVINRITTSGGRTHYFLLNVNVRSAVA
jgi:hypothetical protein